MEMPGRSVGTDYTFGMNGQIKDDEVFKGFMSADFWGYDSRLGRRWEQDPITYKFQSPYVCFNNNPIFFSDPNGLEGEDPLPNTQGHKYDCGDGTREVFDNGKYVAESEYGGGEKRAGVYDLSNFKSAVYPIYQDVTPSIFLNAQRAIASNPEWAVLHYGGFDATRKNQNRLNAGCGSGNGCSALTGGQYQCEEFPVASSVEGGAWNAYVLCVPTTEQKVQAGTLSTMISYFKLSPGDPFMVLLIPSSPVTEKKPVVDLKPFPVPYPTGYKKNVPVTPILEPISIYDVNLPVLNKKQQKETVNNTTSVFQAFVAVLLFVAWLVLN